jgi:hypothetical protein
MPALSWLRAESTRSCDSRVSRLATARMGRAMLPDTNQATPTPMKRMTKAPPSKATWLDADGIVDGLAREARHQRPQVVALAS